VPGWPNRHRRPEGSMPTHTPRLEIAASPELIERGSVYIISLAQIRAAMAPRWERQCGAVWGHLENLMRQRLGPTDFFCAVDDSAALLCLPSLSAEEARICCLRIAHELNTILLGAYDLSKLAIERVSSWQDGSFATAEIAPSQADFGILKSDPSIQNCEPSEQRPGAASTVPGAKSLHRFMPVWDAQKDAVTTYRCHFVAETASAEPMGRQEQFKFALSATMTGMRQATESLQQRLAAGDRFLLWIPVSYDVLGSPIGRMEISAHCRNLPAELRPYLMFEISDLPYGVAQSRLSDLVASLRPFCRGVMAQLPARIPNYGAYLDAGLHAIGLSCSANPAGGEMISEIFKLSVAARRQRILSFVLDIPNDETLHSARECGIALLSGPRIGAAAPRPGSVRRLTAEDIHRQAAPRNAA